ERSVLIVPGDQFGLARHLRIGYGSDADYLMRGLARIDDGIRGLRKAPGRRRGAGARVAARA
ncbi:MAG: hypothetical protein HY613_01510, partial [Candidatus Rokubacteria bacterium]|nr:hypothetical protein [Candidatus Rokubacteria bacterium]